MRRVITEYSAGDGSKSCEVSHAGTSLCTHLSHANCRGTLDRECVCRGPDKAWDEAVAKGWTVVSMKDDWRIGFPQH